MQKDHQVILAEVIKLQKQLHKIEKQNPDDSSVKSLKAEIEEKMNTEAYKLALEEEERRLGEELKKLFSA